jgi:hypothetical protein
MDRSDFQLLAQLKAVPVQAGTPFLNAMKPPQPFEFIGFSEFGTTLHKIKRIPIHVHAHTHTQETYRRGEVFSCSTRATCAKDFFIQ